MPLQSPVVRDLSLWNSSVSESVWEIYTHEKNSLYWSIIIPYLLPSLQSHANFERRFKNLKDDVDGSRAVMDYVKNFNPFKKKHAFHIGKDMADVLKKFKKRINRATKNRAIGVGIEDKKLAAASKMLKCCIEVYRIDSDGTKNSTIHCPTSNPIHSRIIIFHHPNTQLKNREKDTFGFGMNFQLSQPLQEKALTFILRKDRLLKENNTQIQQATRNSENFLISLLNSDVRNVIPRIYKSPYILAKLQNAGFNTNPLLRGRDGLSAFHLCLSLPNSQYLNILYNYVSNNFYQSDETCRKPGDEIVKALNDLKIAFETDFDNSNGVSSLSPIACQRYKGILRFNEYQMNVVKIMKDIQQKSADEIVLGILEEYTNYFLSHVLPNDASIQFENYLTCCNYYENLDSYTSILLLDRLLSVKNKYFSDLVQPLFLMLMSNNYFPKRKHDHIQGMPSDCKECAHRVIPFKYRMNFLEVLRNVIQKVQTGSPGNNASLNDMILKSIQSIPKDEFLLARLKSSLETAINIEVNDTPNVLTIFRTLQVFGEVLETSVLENFASGFLLSAQIPLEIKHTLINIRNFISHYNANAVQGRLHIETQINLFQKIQEELKLIYQILEPVFSSQRFKMKEFIIKSAEPYFLFSEEELKHFATDREIWCMESLNRFKPFMVNILTLFEEIIKNPFPKMEDSKKIKQIQDGAEALNLIFNLKITFDDSIDVKGITVALEDLQKVVESLKSLDDDDITNLHNSFYKYVSLLEQVFNLKVGGTKSEIKCDNLVHLEENLKNWNAFVGEENLKIRKLISEFLKPSFEATMELETAFKDSQLLQNIDEYLGKMYLSKRNQKKIKSNIESLKILENFSYNSEEKALGKENETSTKLLNMLTKEEYRKILLQHSSTFEQSLESKFLKLVNQKMEFLIQKIKLIERILIDEDENIRDLVKWGRSDEIKKHSRFLMRQRYVMELDVKQSLEMLLFDSMNIINKRKDLVDIYTKTNDMLAGADLRNILSHGNILIDSLGTFLDPDDLPSELITKMLELIEDKKALEALSNLWMKEKPMTNEDLKKCMENPDGSQTIADIKKCPRWEGYAAILPNMR